MKTNWRTLCALSLVLSLLAAAVLPGTAYAASLKSRCKTVCDKVTESKDDNKTKISKLAKYVESDSFGYERTVNFKNKKGWAKTYANNFLKKRKGSCYGYAAGFGYLTKYATNLPVRVVIGKTNGFSGKLQPHAWTEVKIDGTWYICDSNMDKYAAKGKGTYMLKKRSSLKKKYNKFKKVKYTSITF